MRIAEGREEQPHWVVRREEVELTEEVVLSRRTVVALRDCHAMDFVYCCVAAKFV